MFENKDGRTDVIKLGFAILFLFVGLGVAFMLLYPPYNVWEREMTGRAELARAEYNRQIVVVEANAKLESAKSLAQAEVERSYGVAKANQVIGESLKNNEAYLWYLWITDVAGANIDKTVVYIPTEANLPILEAGRLPQIANMPSGD